jgi:hypothetical protein
MTREDHVRRLAANAWERLRTRYTHLHDGESVTRLTLKDMLLVVSEIVVDAVESLEVHRAGDDRFWRTPEGWACRIDDAGAGQFKAVFIDRSDASPLGTQPYIVHHICATLEEARSWLDNLADERRKGAGL